MQQNDMVRKIKMQVDGGAMVDLIRVGEINLEDASPQEVPSFDRVVTVLSGVTKINPVDISFKIRRNSDTITVVEKWCSKNEVKDVILIETDGHGAEYQRKILPSCEAGNLVLPEYDAAAPVFAQVNITIFPFNVIWVK